MVMFPGCKNLSTESTPRDSIGSWGLTFTGLEPAPALRPTQPSGEPHINRKQGYSPRGRFLRINDQRSSVEASSDAEIGNNKRASERLRNNARLPIRSGKWHVKADCPACLHGALLMPKVLSRAGVNPRPSCSTARTVPVPRAGVRRSGLKRRLNFVATPPRFEKIYASDPRIREMSSLPATYRGYWS